MKFHVAMVVVATLSGAGWFAPLAAQGPAPVPPTGGIEYQIYLLRRQVQSQETRIKLLEHQLASVGRGNGAAISASPGRPPSSSAYQVVTPQPQALPPVVTTPPPAPATAATQSPQHVVSRGETLSRIAAQYGTSMRDLIAANGLSSPDKIQVGQVLILPAQGGSPQAAAAVDQPPAPSLPAAPATPTSPVNHENMGGETLFSISRSYGVSVFDLQAFNGITDSSHIWPGQIIRIPVGTSQAQTVTSTGWTPPTSATQPARPSVSATPPIQKTPRAGSLKHHVAPGDSLNAIARQYQTETSSIQLLNNIDDANSIRVGQTLVLPADARKTVASAAPAPTPKKKTPQVASTRQPKKPTLKKPAPKTESLGVDDYFGYFVTRGDTIESIARVFGTSASVLRQINDLPPKAQAKAGQQILVPANAVLSS